MNLEIILSSYLATLIPRLLLNLIIRDSCLLSYTISMEQPVLRISLPQFTMRKNPIIFIKLLISRMVLHLQRLLLLLEKMIMKMMRLIMMSREKNHQTRILIFLVVKR